MTVTQARLDAYLARNISAICTRGFHDNNANHCAHFVSHVLGLAFGARCAMMGSGNGTGFSAAIRVHEVFHNCTAVGRWGDLPDALASYLVFITNSAGVNLATRVMANVPRKHVGIYCTGMIWHYSNTRDQVVKQTPAQFAHHYPAPSNAMFYGDL